jgi:hypothetical protein
MFFLILWEDFAIVPTIYKGILLHHLMYNSKKARSVIHCMQVYFNTYHLPYVETGYMAALPVG